MSLLPFTQATSTIVIILYYGIRIQIKPFTHILKMYSIGMCLSISASSDTSAPLILDPYVKSSQHGNYEK